MPDRKEVVKHDVMTPEQIMTYLPNIVFSKLKGRILNALETYLESSDPRFRSLKNEICVHIADTSLYIARQMHRVAVEKGLDVDLTEYIERADTGQSNVQHTKRLKQDVGGNATESCKG